MVTGGARLCQVMTSGGTGRVGRHTNRFPVREELPPRADALPCSCHTLDVVIARTILSLTLDSVCDAA